MKNSFSPLELPIVQRVIHSTGDFSFEDTIRFHPGAIEKGIEAIREGKSIFVDVKMLEAGINKRLLSQFGGKVICYISDRKVVQAAAVRGLTRAETAVEILFSDDGVLSGVGIVAIGNAPTALLKLIELFKSGAKSPPLIVGTPVGFVNAAESKDMLANTDFPFITCLGRKGGSSIAVAIVNALLKLSLPN
ncbi:MAG: precorrin-8X methylmutase [Nitrospirae bacterium]|nr:precorrin-8X methylmutase [Nitrospirota bacterium]